MEYIEGIVHTHTGEDNMNNRELEMLGFVFEGMRTQSKNTSTLQELEDVREVLSPEHWGEVWSF